MCTSQLVVARVLLPLFPQQMPYPSSEDVCCIAARHRFIWLVCSIGLPSRDALLKQLSVAEEIVVQPSGLLHHGKPEAD